MDEAMARRLFDGALRKFRQMEREIAEVKDPRVRANLAHSHSKLGMFLGDAIGDKTWLRAWELLAESDARRAEVQP